VIWTVAAVDEPCTSGRHDRPTTIAAGEPRGVFHFGESQKRRVRCVECAVAMGFALDDAARESIEAERVRLSGAVNPITGEAPDPRPSGFQRLDRLMRGRTAVKRFDDLPRDVQAAHRRALNADGLDSGE
jgi:hypothetical protein